MITGASSGIGWHLALQLAQEQVDIVICARREERLIELKDKIEASGGKCFWVAGDVTQPQTRAQLVQTCKAKLGGLDILINNAGVQKDASIDEMTLEQWNRVIAINLTGQFLCSRAAIREFKKRGVVSDVSCSAGKIICMSSVHEIIPWAGHVNYAASKGGVMLMMKSIAQEVAPFRIRVNSICPGAIRTPINRDAWETKEAYDDLMTLIPYRRIGEPDDIGRAAAWLASDQADYVNGTSMVVDGGMCLYPGFATGG